jgi:hypothetical protein
METDMPKFIIFPSKTPGAMLAHAGEFSSAKEAFADFTRIVGDHAERGAYAVVAVTDAELDQVEEWALRGAPAYDAPAWLDDAISRDV